MEDDLDSPPAKRVKTDIPQMDGTFDSEAIMLDQSDLPGARADNALVTAVLDDTAKERAVGIIAFVDDSRGVFRGILKKRYTDFLVNEIAPDGRVLHLQSLKVKNQVKQPAADATSTPDFEFEPRVKVENVKPERPAAGETAKEEPGNAKGNENSVEEKEENEKAPATTNGSGKDVRLRNDSVTVPDSPTTQLGDDDRAKLVEYFNETAASQLSALHQSILKHPNWKSRDHPTVRTEFTSDRSIRSQIHQDIRRIFSSKIESSTDKDGILVLTAAAPKSTHGGHRGWGGAPDKTKFNNGKQSNRQGKLSWDDRGGEYLHFSLYKENKDTLEVISYLSKGLRTATKTFQFAGTKDRRAVTVQRVSAYRTEAGRLAALNGTLRYAAVGDFEYQKQGLELGDLSGNEFVVTLRDCRLEGAIVGTSDRKARLELHLSESLRQLRENGFLNFYGLQRFGTFATRTDVVGVRILQGDFEGACDAILEFSPMAINAAASEVGVLVGQDDRARAEGINIYRTTGRVNDALDQIPRKFSAETNIIRHLGRSRQDFLGALLGIQRNLRLMYVHAYQSLVWNLAVGERWRLYGGKVVEGDLVLVSEHKDKQVDADSGAQQGVDADGEVIIEPSGEDRAYDKDDMFERARALTAEEASSGKYTIFDLVLPLPGFDVLYPANECGAWYKTFMASEAGGGLDPYHMRRPQKDFSLSGSYRKILARIGEDWEVRVEEYAAGEGKGDQQFAVTDMERIKQGEMEAYQARLARGKEAQNREGTTQSDLAVPTQTQDAETANPEEGAPAESNTKLAVVLKFQLGSSQYATMALRELSMGGIQSYKAEFMGGR